MSRLPTVWIPSIRIVATNQPTGWPSTSLRTIDPPARPPRISVSPPGAVEDVTSGAKAVAAA